MFLRGPSTDFVRNQGFKTISIRVFGPEALIIRYLDPLKILFEWCLLWWMHVHPHVVVEGGCVREIRSRKRFSSTAHSSEIEPVNQ